MMNKSMGHVVFRDQVRHGGEASRVIMRATLILLGAVSLLALDRPAQAQVVDHGDGNFTVSGSFAPSLPYSASGGTDPAPEILVQGTTIVDYSSSSYFFLIDADGYTVTVEAGASIRNANFQPVFSSALAGSHTVYNIAGELQSSSSSISAHAAGAPTWDITLSGTLRNPTINSVVLGQDGDDRLTMQPGSLIESGNGYIDLRGGADELIFNGGTFDGLSRIFFGPGNDLLELNASPVGTPHMFGDAGTDTVRLNNSGSFSLAALESGWERLEMDGTAWTLSGRTGNTFSGGVSIIDGGTLTLEVAGGNQTVSGAVTGEGTLSKTGTDALTLTGDGSAFGGNAGVGGGTLLVDGTLGNGTDTMTVSGAGTLGGNGTIAMDVSVVTGTISAGASPGVLTITGDLDLNAGATSLFEMGTPGAVGAPGGDNDFIVVGGDLDLDGTLRLRAADGASQITAGYYTLYEAGGAVSFTGDADDGFATIDSGSLSTDIYRAAGGAGATMVNALVGAAGQPMQFWDGGGPPADGIVAGGDGNWTATATNWTIVDAGIDDIWRSGVAIFGGTAGTVIVDDTAGAVGFEGLQFKTDGYVIEGDPLVMTGDSVAGGNADASFVTVDGGVTAEIASDLTGVGLDKIVGGGTLILSGANSYVGTTTVSTGVLMLGSDTALGDAGNTIVINAGGLLDLGSQTVEQAVVDLSGNGVISNGMIEATTSFTQSGGTMAADATTPAYTLTAGTMSGLVDATGYNQSGGETSGTVTTETYQLTGGTLSGTATASTLFDLREGLVSGELAGAAELVKSGAGTVTLTAANSYAGGTTVTGGKLVGDAASIRGDVANDATVVFDQAVDASHAGAFSGAGAFIKQGSAVLAYDGDGSAFTGATTVEAGSLIVGSDVAHEDAVLGGLINVADGGLLGGHGTVGAVTLASGATIAPGSSIGTLTVDGDITFDAGSTYKVEVDPTNSGSDLIHVTGKATLDRSSVVHVGIGGTYDRHSSYTILTAEGGVDGTFGEIISDFAFLDPRLTYDTDSAYLQLTRNDVDFGEIAGTFNQRNTGNGVDSLGAGNPLWDAAVTLGEETARAAFDQLSGEAHTSVKGVLIDDSRFVRDAATDRIRAAFAAVGAADAPVLAYGEGARTLADADTLAPAAWGRAFGAWRDIDGDGNAAAISSSTGGFITGIDGGLGDNWRAGFLAGYSHTSFDVDGRASSGSSTNWHLGLYGGARWDGVMGGALGLRTGAAYTWHDIETARAVAFPGFADSLSADYGAGTAQVFGELGYAVTAGAIGLEPFANLAHVNLHSDGFTETGGAAALISRSSSTDVTFTTLGLRASTGFMLGGINATARGMVGWRHAFSDTTPLSTFAFAGSDPFSIAGIPIARDAAIVEAGLDFDLSPKATLGIAYQGQFAGSDTQNAINASLKVAF